MQIGDYIAHVLVDGDEATEYHVEFETPTRATCWIASEEGKKFSIKWHSTAETRTKGNMGWVTVDGIFCSGFSMAPGVREDDEGTNEMSCIRNGSKTRDFMFSHIQTSDDDRLLNKEVPQGFGEISLEIAHGRLAKTPRRLRNKNIGVPDDDDKLHETSKKAAHHRICFGPERARQKNPFKRVVLIVNDEPTLFFIFKYRPIALLQANGLVPRPNDSDSSPSPEPDSDRPQSNDLHKTELRERIQNLKNELKRLQDQEARFSEEPKPKRIKSEDPGLGKKSVSEVIDLTKD